MFAAAKLQVPLMDASCGGGETASKSLRAMGLTLRLGPRGAGVEVTAPINATIGARFWSSAALSSRSANWFAFQPCQHFGLGQQPIAKIGWNVFLHDTTWHWLTKNLHFSTETATDVQFPGP